LDAEHEAMKRERVRLTWEFPMSENTQILIVIWAFWIVVIGLDLVALFRVRRLALGPISAVLWTIWIIVAPIVGAVSSFIVATSAGGSADRDGSAATWPQMQNLGRA
jgi:hypothetical protein